MTPQEENRIQVSCVKFSLVYQGSPPLLSISAVLLWIPRIWVANGKIWLVDHNKMWRSCCSCVHLFPKHRLERFVPQFQREVSIIELKLGGGGWNRALTRRLSKDSH